MRRFGPRSAIGALGGLLLGAFVNAGGAAAQGGSLSELFERHELIGVFAADCGSLTTKTNPYFVTRVLDQTHVQDDKMIGPTTRDFAIIFDQAHEITADEIAVSGARDDGQRTESVWRLEDRRVHVVENSLSGQKVIAGGKWVSNGQNLPWLSKCDAGGNPQQVAPATPAAPPATSAATSGGCNTENYTFSAVLSQSARADSVSTAGAACFYKVAPIHPDQVQFTSASIVVQPSNGAFEQTGAFAFRYQPRPGFKGIDECAIRVCGHNSERAGCATVTYRVTVK
jgi:hypothetical protein